MAKLIIANWKQNMCLRDIHGWFEMFIPRFLAANPTNIEVIIAPSHLYLPVLHEFKVANPYIRSAAQDVSLFENGAHTGQVGAFQISDYCDYCLVGHSETAVSFEDAVTKSDLCLKEKVTPIVCFVSSETVSSSMLQGAVLAWEDPQNISHDGKYNAKPISEIESQVRYLKSNLPANRKLLYGGSVNRQNASDLSTISELDGVLVGNASLDPMHFFEIVMEFENLAN